MEQVKATLSRKVGPFTVGAWLLIAIGGVALGLAIKRTFAGGGEPGFSGTGLPSNPDAGLSDDFSPSMGVVAGSQQQQDFATFTARTTAEYNRFREEIGEQLDDYFGGSQPDDPTNEDPSFNDPDQDGQPGSGGGNRPGQGGPNPTTIGFTVRNGETWQALGQRVQRALGGDSVAPLNTIIGILKSNSSGMTANDGSGNPVPGETIHIHVQSYQGN
ncbi:MAG: hypothetical protein GY771_05340 [bacterium]|nr:hypothetical protein [bacterium]